MASSHSNEKNGNAQPDNRLLLAFELSNTKWRLVFSNGERFRHRTIQAADKEALDREIMAANRKFGLGEDVSILSCFEAGRDGFWLHRYLTRIGIENIVVDSCSIEVNRRAKRAKTDRIDGNSLIRMLIRYYAGEKKIWSVVRVPSVEEEDLRQLHRELEGLIRERTKLGNRIKALLVAQGIRLTLKEGFLVRLGDSVTGDGRPLPPELKSRIGREYERYLRADTLVKALRKTQRDRIKGAKSTALQKVEGLMKLRGVGQRSAWVFVMEFFGWRQFKNRRQIASLAGLAPTPYASGDMMLEQGVSKAGNRRIRSMMVEISWLWLKFQPESKLSKWYFERFHDGGRRMRRVGIVALSRKLLIAFWEYLEKGKVPEGARLKPV